MVLAGRGRREALTASPCDSVKLTLVVNRDVHRVEPGCDYCLDPALLQYRLLAGCRTDQDRSPHVACFPPLLISRAAVMKLVAILLLGLTVSQVALAASSTFRHCATACMSGCNCTAAVQQVSHSLTLGSKPTHPPAPAAPTQCPTHVSTGPPHPNCTAFLPAQQQPIVPRASGLHPTPAQTSSECVVHVAIRPTG